MEVIKRTVNLKSRDHVEPVDVVQCESLIAIQITVSDMTIPAGTLAMAVVLNDDTSTWTGNATVDGQTVTVEPDTKTFGYPGQSELQIQFTSGDLNGFTFPIPVNVAKNNMEVDDNPSTAGLIADQVGKLVDQKMGLYARKTDISDATNSGATAKEGQIWTATKTGAEWKDKPAYTAKEVGAIASSARGTANGVASLDADGKVPSDQLPDISSGMYINVADYVSEYGWTIKAINAAIADCPRHGTVFVPIPDNTAGQYIDDKTADFVNIEIDKPMTLLGEYTGYHWADVDSHEFTNALILTNYTGNAVIHVTSGGVSIKNISIRCPYAANGILIDCYTYSDGTTHEPAKYHVVENCSVYPANGGACYRTDGAIMSTFRRCLAYGGKYGYVFTSQNSHPTTSIVLENCWAAQFFDTGYYLNDVSYSTLISCGADCENLVNSDAKGLRGYLFENCRGVQCIGCGCEFAIYCAVFSGCRECSFGGTVIPRFFSTGNYAVWVDSYTNAAGTVYYSDVVLSPVHYDGSQITNTSYTPILCGTGSEVALLGTNFPSINDQGALKTPSIVYYTGMA